MPLLSDAIPLGLCGYVFLCASFYLGMLPFCEEKNMSFDNNQTVLQDLHLRVLEIESISQIKLEQKGRHLIKLIYFLSNYVQTKQVILHVLIFKQILSHAKSYSTCVL